MGLIVKEKGISTPPIPEGIYQAVCYCVIDLGTHFDRKWEKDSHKLHIGWELPSERIMVDRDGVKVDLPRVISNRYTLSLGERATLRKHLEAWRGKKFTPAELEGFDIFSVLGANAQIQITHSLSADGSRTYANIGAIMAIPKTMAALKPENPPVVFSLSDCSAGDPLPAVPEWLQEIIAESNEWKALQGLLKPSKEPSHFDDDESDRVPF